MDLGDAFFFLLYNNYYLLQRGMNEGHYDDNFFLKTSCQIISLNPCSLDPVLFIFFS